MDTGSFKGWLQDAVKSRKPVLLLFAPAGHALIEQLGKIKKNDEVKIAKFGHVTANDANHALMKKYKLKRVPAVLIGSRGDPAALNRFQGRMDAEAIERALSIAVRNKLTKAEKKKPEEPKGRDMVTQITSHAKINDCMSHHGICMLFFFTDSQRRQGVKNVEKLAEEAQKHKKINKKLKVAWRSCACSLQPRASAAKAGTQPLLAFRLYSCGWKRNTFPMWPRSWAWLCETQSMRVMMAARLSRNRSAPGLLRCRSLLCLIGP